MLARLRRDGADAEAVAVERFLDCRYAGQGYELRIPVGTRATPTRRWPRSTRPTAPSTATPSSDPDRDSQPPGHGARAAAEAAARRRRGGLPRRRRDRRGDDRLARRADCLRCRRGTCCASPSPTPVPGPRSCPARHHDRRAAGLDGDRDAHRPTRPHDPGGPAHDRHDSRPAVDAITAAVIGGSLRSIADEMGSGSPACPTRRSSASPRTSAARSATHEAASVRGDAVHAAAIRPDRRLPRWNPRRFEEVGDGGARETSSSTTIRTTAPRTSPTWFAVPVFVDGELVGFSVTTAHHLDLGALTPRLVRDRRRRRRVRRGPAAERGQGRGRGRRNEAAWRIIRDNLPHPPPRGRRHGGPGRRGQARRQARYAALIREHGLATVRAAAEHQMDHSERLLRNEIAQLPDGTYEAEGFIDGFLDHPDPALLEPAHQGGRHGRGLGPARRPRRHLRAGRPADQHAVRRHDRHRDPRDAALAAAGPDRHDAIATNAGLFRPVTISAPLGTLANRLPRAHDRPLLPGEHRGRRAHARAGAGAARGGWARASATSRSSPSPASSTAARGSTWTSSRAPTAAATAEGRAGRRGHAVRQHAQQPDRGHRVALSRCACGATSCAPRAARATGRWRGGRGSIREIEFLADGGVLARGRRQLGRRRPACSAAARARRARWTMNPGTADERSLPSKLPLHAGEGGRGAWAVGPVRRRLRRAGRTRPGGARARQRRRILGVGETSLSTRETSPATWLAAARIGAAPEGGDQPLRVDARAGRGDRVGRVTS